MASLSDYSNYGSSDEAVRGSRYVRMAGFFLTGSSALSVVSLFSAALRSKFQDQPSAGLFLLAILLSALFSLLPILFKKSSCKSNLLTHGCLIGIAVIMSVFIAACGRDEMMRRMAFLLLVILMSIFMTILRSYSLKRICQLRDDHLFIYLFAEDMLQFLLILVRMLPVILIVSYNIMPLSSSSSFNPGRGNNTVILETVNSSSVPAVTDSGMQSLPQTADHDNETDGRFFEFTDKVAIYFDDVKVSDVYFLFAEDHNDRELRQVIHEHQWTGFLMSSRSLFSVSLILVLLSWISLIYLQVSEAAKRENSLQKGCKKSVHLVSFRKRFEAELDELSDSRQSLRTGFSCDDSSSFPSRKRNIFYSLVDGVTETDGGEGSKKGSNDGPTPDIVVSHFNQLARRGHRLKSRIIDAALLLMVFMISFAKAVLSFSLPLVFKSNIVSIILILTYYAFMPLGSVLAAHTAPLMTCVRNFGQQVFQTPYPKRKVSGQVLMKTSLKSVCIILTITSLITGLAVSIMIGERYPGEAGVRSKRELPQVTGMDSISQDSPFRAVGLIFILILMSIGCSFISSTVLFLIRSRSKSSSRFHSIPGSLSSPTPAALAAFQQLYQSHQNQMMTTFSTGQAGTAVGSVIAFFLIQYNITWSHAKQ